MQPFRVLGVCIVISRLFYLVLFHGVQIHRDFLNSRPCWSLGVGGQRSHEGHKLWEGTNSWVWNGEGGLFLLLKMFARLEHSFGLKFFVI